MAFIVNVGGNNRLQIGGEEFVRKTGFGTSWRKVRIGVWMSMNSSGASVTTALLQLGLCEGSSDTYTSANTTGYLGTAFGSTEGVGSCTFVYNPSGFYTQTNAGLTRVQRVGNSTTRIYLNTGLISQAISFTNPSYYFFDVTKLTDSTYTSVFWWDNGTVNPPAISRSDYLYYLERETGVATGGLSRTDTGVTYAGNLNALDTVSIYWNKAAPTMEIQEINFMRFA